MRGKTNERAFILPAVLLIAGALVMISNVAIQGWYRTMDQNRKLHKRIELQAKAIHVVREDSSQ